MAETKRMTGEQVVSYLLEGEEGVDFLRGRRPPRSTSQRRGARGLTTKRDPACAFSMLERW